MTQTRRLLNVPELMTHGIANKLTTMGLQVRDIGIISSPPHDLSLEVQPVVAHHCFGQWEEFFPNGVPVLQEVLVQQESDYGPWWKATLPHRPYWTGPILLLHQGTKPDSRYWRLLHFLEAASLLATTPGLGAVRYASPKGTDGYAEFFIRNSGKAYVWCGTTPKGHHAAYTTTGVVQIIERRL